MIISDIEDAMQKSMSVIFFNQIPNDSDKKELNMLGVDFLEYLPKNIFHLNSFSIFLIARFLRDSCNLFLGLTF